MLKVTLQFLNGERARERGKGEQTRTTVRFAGFDVLTSGSAEGGFDDLTSSA